VLVVDFKSKEVFTKHSVDITGGVGCFWVEIWGGGMVSKV